MRESRGDRAARRVDVEVDVLVRVLGLEEQHLRDDQVGGRVVDRPDDEDDAFLEQARVDVVRAFAASALLDHHRDEAQAPRLFHVRHLLGWTRMR